MRINPWFRMLDAIVAELEGRGYAITTRACVDLLADRMYRSVGVAIATTLHEFARRQTESYFSQRSGGHRVWELWRVHDDEGREHRRWVRRADLTASGVERVLRFNREGEAIFHGANDRRELDRDALLLRDPSGEQLRLGELEQQ